MKRILILTAIMMITGIAYAQDQLYNLGSITVDESGYAYGINDYGRATAAFSGNALDSVSASNAADLLGSVPGVYFSKSGIVDAGAGSMVGSFLKIRGLGEMPNAGILTIIDDRPQSMAVFRHPLYDTLALDNVDSMEIIKGPSAAEYGNQAAAGVINITTKQMKQDGTKSTVKLSAGNDFTQDYYIDNMSKTGVFDYAASAGYNSTQGFRRDSDSYQQEYSGKLGYAFNEEIRFGGNISYTDVLAYNPGPVGAVWDRGEEACRVKQLSGDVRVEKTSEDFKGKIILYSDTGSNDFLKSMVPYGPAYGVTVTGSTSDFVNFGARFMEEWNLIPGNVIKIGFDWQNFGGNFKNHFSEAGAMYLPDTNASSNENDYAPYFLLAQKVGITSIMLGLRYGMNTKWGNDLIPQAGFTLSLFEGHKIFANVSKGYKTPAMGTVIFSPDSTGLKPEDFWQYEAGFEHEIMNVFTYSASVYQIEAQNLLKTDPIDPLALKNSGFAIIRGVEGGAELKLSDYFKLGTSAAYNDPGSASAQTALLTGRHYASASFAKTFELRLEAEYALSRYDQDNRLGRLQDYTLWNAGIKYNTAVLGAAGSLYLDVDNILDTHYDVKAGYPAAGFLVRGGAIFKI